MDIGKNPVKFLINLHIIYVYKDKVSLTPRLKPQQIDKEIRYLFTFFTQCRQTLSLCPRARPFGLLRFRRYTRDKYTVVRNKIS